MPLFETDGSASNHSAVDEQLAQKLAIAIQSRRRLLAAPSHKAWVQWVYRLRVMDKQPIELIEKAIEWYREHHRMPRCPDIRSGKAFRFKFHSLLKCMEITSSVDPKPLKALTAEEAEIARTLRLRLLWSEHHIEAVQKAMPKAIRITLETITTLQTKCRSVLNDLHATPSDKEFSHVILSMFVSRHDFTIDWFVDAHTRLYGWKEWNGNMVASAFKYGSPTFMSVMQRHLLQRGYPTWLSFWNTWLKETNTP